MYKRQILNTLSDRRYRWIISPRFQEGTQSAKDKLERHSQERSARMGLTWEEAEVAALNRQEWHGSVAQYVHVDVG